MTKETLETIILGEIVKELKDEIQIGRQENLSRAIIESLHVHVFIDRRELLTEFAKFIQKYKNKGLDYDCVEREVDAFLNQ